MHSENIYMILVTFLQTLQKNKSLYTVFKADQ